MEKKNKKQSGKIPQNAATQDTDNLLKKAQKKFRESASGAVR